MAFQPERWADYLTDVGERPITVEGTLYVKADRAWVEIDAIVLPILDKGFEQRLIDAVPCYVGGPYFYADEVRLTGTLISDGPSLAIQSVASAELRREDEGCYEIQASAVNGIQDG